MQSITPFSRRSFVLWALLCAVLLVLFQVVFAGLLNLISQSSLWPIGTALGYFLAGGLCALKTTRGLEEAASTRRGCLSGLLAGLFSIFLTLFIITLLIMTNNAFWKSTMALGRILLFAFILPFVLCMQLICTGLAMLAGSLAGQFTARLH